MTQLQNKHYHFTTHTYKLECFFCNRKTVDIQIIQFGTVNSINTFLKANNSPHTKQDLNLFMYLLTLSHHIRCKITLKVIKL